jgi:hypothetical protein
MSSNFTLGGYDAKSCPEKVRKTFDPAYADVVAEAPTPGAFRRMTAGVRHEEVVGAAWLAALPAEQIAMIPACDRSDASKRRREKLTAKIMANPGTVTVIWNARMRPQSTTHRTGEPDAIVLHGFRDNGRPIWVPVDVKDHNPLEGAAKAKPWLISTLAAPAYADATSATIGDGVPQKVDAMQLAHYHRMLEHLGYAADTPIGGVIGRDGSSIVWHHLDAALYGRVGAKVAAIDVYDREFASRVEIVEAAQQGIALVGPEWKPECGECPFRAVCHDELKLVLDHITLLPGVTADRAQAHYAADVRSVTELASLDHRTAVLVDAAVPVTTMLGVAATTDPATPVTELGFRFKPAQIAALAATGVGTASDVSRLDPRTAKYEGTGVWRLADSIDQARVAKVDQVHRARNVEFVDVPRATIEVDFDIEDAALPGAGKLVYQFGLRIVGRKRAGEDVKERAEYYSHDDFTGTEAGEAKAFASFWEQLMATQVWAKANKWGFKAFHYTHHEPSEFARLAAKHAGQPGVPSVADIEAFFASRDCVDLYPVLAKQLVWPTESVSLKKLATHVSFAWRDEAPGGDNSITWYTEAMETTDLDQRDALIERLRQYNADDCHAQLALRNWLTRLGENRRPGRLLPSVEELDARFTRLIRRPVR